MAGKRHFAVAAAALALTVGAPASASALVVGVGDQKADMFSDPLFASVGVKHARIAIAWDALSHDWQRAEIDRWMLGAQAAGVEPLVGFMHARGDRRRVLPSPSRLKYEFRRLRQRYPWVRNFATWNEVNHCGEPTCHRPKLVAAYFRAMRRECPVGCRILAAEMLDMPNMAKWMRAFRRHAKVEPRYWGLHNYVDANRFRTKGTRTMLRLTKGQIWFTETGGIVERRNRRKVTFEESPRHAAEATRWVFDRLAPLSPRITRVYLYHWNAPRTIDTWDSGLVGPDGTPRPAFRVLRRELAVQQAKRDLLADGRRVPANAG